MQKEAGKVNPGFPGVSVIIPCYNYARFLGAALDSVLGQTYSNLEVIVIDDGSSDNTAEVAALYAGRIRYIHQENQGLSASRNNGIALASHDLLAFLDADDEWEPEFVSTLIDKLQELPDSFGLVACLDHKIGADGKRIPDRAHDSITGEVNTRDLLLKNRFFPGATVVRKDLFLKTGGFDTELRSSEDRDMWIRLSSVCRLWILPDMLIRVRKHGSNMSGNGLRMRNNIRKVLAKARRENLVPRVHLPFWMQAYSILDYQISWIFFGEGNRGAALAGILRSLLLWPFPMKHSRLDVPAFFRLRAFFRFIFAWLKSLFHVESKAS